jgi:tripartite-type tricarboxylate transporter receptor subunit TctC
MKAILGSVLVALGLAGMLWPQGSVVAQGAAGEQRVALVIGNAAYKRGPLANPVNDARDLAASLRQLGFSVLLKENASQREMKQAVRDFGRQLGRGHVALFFYAGHGVQVKDRNFLMPVDAVPESEADTEDLAVDLRFVLDTMEESGSRVNIVILDACRDNPFPRSSRSGVRGLATVPRVTGTFISYATGPGQTAADGAGRNSPFTKNLVQSLRSEDSSLLNVFQRVRDGVHSETKGRQVPWDANGVIGQFYFRPGTQVASAAPSSIVASAQDAEILFWDSIKSSTNLADFQAYLDQYPEGRFAALARNRVRPAAPTQVASVQPTIAPIAPLVLSGSYNVSPDTSFPSKPIRMVVPFAAGGLSDVVGRILAQAMSSVLGQPIIIENRAGAGGTIGADSVAKSAPDGYSLLIGTTATQAIAPGIYSRMPYDPRRDFAPVVIVGESPQVLVVGPSVPARSVKELIDLARARPGALAVASSGLGSMSHLASELFKARTATNFTHVAYKGTAPALTDLIAGNVQATFASPAVAVPQVRSGAIRALAVTSQQRSPQFPDVPTFSEAGVSGMEASDWYGVFAPAGTSTGVVSRLYQAVRQAVSSSEVARRFSDLGLIAKALPPNDAQVFVQSEGDKWGQIVRAAGVRAD